MQCRFYNEETNPVKRNTALKFEMQIWQSSCSFCSRNAGARQKKIFQRILELQKSSSVAACFTIYAAEFCTRFITPVPITR